MEFKLLKREEIDDKRWNGCVHFALSAPPYGYTWYLDVVAPEWEGIVVDEYKMVMPVIRAKKWGIAYSYQPFFTQQLGIFTSQAIDQRIVDEFFKRIPKDFRWIEMALNENNFAPKNVDVKKRQNYLLDLKPAYEDIRKKYSGNILRKLKKAKKAELFIDKQIRPEELADFYRKHTANKIADFKDSHYYMMMRLIYQILHYHMGFLVGVRDKNNNLLAVNCILQHPQRVINLMPSSNEQGNKNGAMAFLLDFVIQQRAGNYQFFDFEGSMIPGVAQFFKGFGARPVDYYFVKINRLPKILRIFKK